MFQPLSVLNGTFFLACSVPGGHVAIFCERPEKTDRAPMDLRTKMLFSVFDVVDLK